MSQRRDLKILWHGDVIWSQSGYANEILWLVRRLQKEGFPVAQASKAGLSGHWIDFTMPDGVLRMYPQVDDPHGTDALFYGSKHWGANLAITMIDAWVLNPHHLQLLKQLGVKYWGYLPIDADPVPKNVLANLPFFDKIITFSKFGHNALSKAGFASEMIYEGVDMNELISHDKLEARKKYGVPTDGFIWGMIAANKENPPRKSFQQAMEAFKMFLEKHPNSYLFLQTQQISPTSFPIMEYANFLGIGDRMIFLDQLFSSILATRDDIVWQMNCFDALLHPSSTEGFGLTPVEAQSCGVPALVNGCHSQPELVIEGKTGSIAKPGHKWFNNSGTYWEIPDPIAVYNSMEKIWTMLQNNPQGVAKDCRQNVADNFDIDKIFKERWMPLFEEMQATLPEPPKPELTQTPPKA